MEDSDNSESDEFEPSQISYYHKDRPSSNTQSRGAANKIPLSLKANKRISQFGPQTIGSKSCQSTSTLIPRSKPNSKPRPGNTPLKNLSLKPFFSIKDKNQEVKTAQGCASKTRDIRPTPSSSKSLVCSHCDKYFADTSVLTEHLYKVLNVNASKKNGSSDDAEMSDKDTTCLSEEEVEEPQLSEELEGLPAAELTTLKRDAQKDYDRKFVCLICYIVLNSQYQCSKHRGEYHPEQRNKTIFKQISAPVNKYPDQNSRKKRVPVVTIKGLNRIIVPNQNTQKTASSLHKSPKHKVSARDQTFSDNPKYNQHMKQCRSHGNPQGETSNGRQNTNHTKSTSYMCVECRIVVNGHETEEHWRRQHPGLEETKNLFVPVHVPVCENGHDTEKMTQKIAEISRKRKSNDNPEDQGKQKKMSQMGPKRVTEIQGGNYDNASNDSETDDQIIYQCGRCLLHFISTDTLSVHFELCESQPLNAVICAKCGLSFPSDELTCHIYQHHYERNITNFNIFQTFPHIPQTANPTKNQDRSKVNLYKCSVCDLHFVNENSLRLHLWNNYHKEPRHLCKICHYVFCETSLKHHEVLHHDEMGLAHQDFNIISKPVENNSKTNEKRVKTWTAKAQTFKTNDLVISTDSEESDTSISEDGNVEDSDMEEGRTPSEGGQDLPPATKLPKFNKRKLKDNMHKCEKCPNIFFTKSKQPNNMCSKCKNTIPDTRQQCQDVPVIANDSDPTRPAQEVENQSDPNGNIIFKCAVCSIHFTASSTLNKHLSIEAHDAEIRIGCPICNLVFSGESISRHTKKHHRELNLTIEDYNIISRSVPLRVCINRGTEVKQPSGNCEPENHVRPKTSDGRHNVEEHKRLYKCTICNVHFIQRETWRAHLSSNKSHRPTTNNTKCTICHLTFSRKSIGKHIKLHHTLFKLKREDFYIIKNTRKAQNKAQIVPEIGKNTVEQSAESSTKISQNINKTTETENQNTCENIIYRCEECDVYFMRESIYLLHCREHTALGLLDYLNCPECNLNFENDSIGAHRKKHHSKDNNLQAVVKTYQTYTQTVNKDNVMQVQTNEEIARPETVEVLANNPNQVITWKRINIINKIVQEVEMQNAENTQLDTVSNNDNQDTRAASKDNVNELCNIPYMHQNCRENINTAKIQNLQTPQTISELVIEKSIQKAIEIQSVENLTDVNGVALEVNDTSTNAVFEVIIETGKECPRDVLKPVSPRYDANITETQSKHSSVEVPENSYSTTIETMVRESREMSDRTNYLIPGIDTSQYQILIETSPNHEAVEEMLQNQHSTSNIKEYEEVPLDFTSPNVNQVKQSQNDDNKQNDADLVLEDLMKNNIEVSCKIKDEVENTDDAENIEKDNVNKTEDLKIDDEDTMCWWNSQVEIVSVSEDQGNSLTESEVERQLMDSVDKPKDLNNLVEFEISSNIGNTKSDEANIETLNEKANVQTEMNKCLENATITVGYNDCQPATDDAYIKPSQENIYEEFSNIRLCTDSSVESTNIINEKLKLTIEMNNEHTLTNRLQYVNNDRTSTSNESTEIRQTKDDTTEEDSTRKVELHDNEGRSQTPKQCDALSLLHKSDPVTHFANNNLSVTIGKSDTNSNATQKVYMEHSLDISEHNTAIGTINTSDLNKTQSVTNELKEVNEDNARYEINIRSYFDCGQEHDAITETEVQLTNQVDDYNNIDETAKLHREKSHYTEQFIENLGEPSNRSENIAMKTGKSVENIFQPIENTILVSNGTPLKQTIIIQNPFSILQNNLENETHKKTIDETHNTTCSENTPKNCQNKYKHLNEKENINEINNPKITEVEQEHETHEPTKIRNQTFGNHQNPFMVYIPDSLLGEIQDKDKFLTTAEEEQLEEIKAETIEYNYNNEEVIVAKDEVNETIETVESTELNQSRDIYEKYDDNNQIQSQDTKNTESDHDKNAYISLKNNTISQNNNTKLNEATENETSNKHHQITSDEVNETIDKFLTTAEEEQLEEIKAETIEYNYNNKEVIVAKDEVNETIETVQSTEWNQSREIYEKYDGNNQIQSKDTEHASISFRSNTIHQNNNTKLNEASEQETFNNNGCVLRSPKIPLNSIIKEEGVEIIDEGIEVTDDEDDNDVIFVSTSTELMNIINVVDSDDETDETRSGRKNKYSNIKIPQPIIVHVSDDESSKDEVTVKKEKYEQEILKVMRNLSQK